MGSCVLFSDQYFLECDLRIFGEIKGPNESDIIWR